MPFLEALDASDVAALSWLASFSTKHHRGYLDQVLSHSTLVGGIADEHTSLVAALLNGAESAASPAHSQTLLSTLMDPRKIVVEERTLTLPQAGQVVLAVVRMTDSPSDTMDLLEGAVESHGELMAIPFPVNYVSLLVADLGLPYGGGGGANGFLFVQPSRYGDFAYVIAHEAAHTYWAFPPTWLQEGGAEFLTWIAGNKGPTRWNFTIGSDSCSHVKTLSQLEQAPAYSFSSRSNCHYRMGFAFFYDLYNVLGDAEFRRGFGELFERLNTDTSRFTSSKELYRRLDRDPSEPECTGPETSLCFLRAAFVTSSPDPETAGTAWHWIHYWYYGPPDPAQ